MHERCLVAVHRGRRHEEGGHQEVEQEEQVLRQEGRLSR